MDATERTQAPSALKYIEKLNEKEKHRYHLKILDIDGVDPYDIPKESWSAHPDNLPDVNYISIVNYFVYGTSAYTTGEFKAYKSLKAYRLFISGWVRDIWTYRPDGCQNVVVTAKFQRLKAELNDAFKNSLDITCVATPNTTGWFEVSVDGELVHSKKNGDGFVDREAKFTKIIKAIEAKM